MIGGSAETRKRAASHSARNAIVVAVLWAYVEPIPGVSISTTPCASAGDGCSTSTSATASRFPGFASSVTYRASTAARAAASGTADTSSLLPSEKSTRTCRTGPERIRVGMAVSGTTELGSTASPSRAFNSVDLPRLNWPSTAR